MANVLFLAICLLAACQIKGQNQKCTISKKTGARLSVDDLKQACRQAAEKLQSYAIKKNTQEFACCDIQLEDASLFQGCKFMTRQSQRLSTMLQACHKEDRFLINYDVKSANELKFSCCVYKTRGWWEFSMELTARAKKTSLSIDMRVCGIEDCYNSASAKLHHIDEGDSSGVGQLYYHRIHSSDVIEDLDHASIIVTSDDPPPKLTMVVAYVTSARLFRVTEYSLDDPTMYNRTTCSHTGCHGRFSYLAQMNMRLCKRREDQDGVAYFGITKLNCKKCHCVGRCHPVSGKCVGRCEWGFSDSTCQTRTCPTSVQEYKSVKYTWSTNLPPGSVKRNCLHGYVTRKCRSDLSWGEVVSFGCEFESFCSKTTSTFDSVEFVWHRATVGESIQVPCVVGHLSRVCNGHEDWGEVVSTGCISKGFCSKTTSTFDSVEYIWGRTTVGEYIRVPCYVGYLRRTCKDREVWGEVVSTGCESNKRVLANMDTLIRKNISDSNQLDNIVTSLKNFTKKASVDVTVAKKVARVVSHILDADEDVIHAPKHNLTGKVKAILDDYTSSVQVQCGDSVSLPSKNLNIVVQEIENHRKPITVHTTFETPNTGRSSHLEGPSFTLNTDKISEHCFRLKVIGYTTSKLFSRSNESVYGAVSISVDGTYRQSRSKELITYTIERPRNDKRNVSCVFWDVTRKMWSTEGVRTEIDERGKTTCKSLHLTSFSMMLQTNVDTKNEQLLTYITYIGCGLSVLGLLLTILTYSIFPSLYKYPTGQIMLNICVSLFLLNLVFLIGSQDSDVYGDSLCIAVAIGIHYFLLTSLLWMMLQAVYMYKQIVVVYHDQGEYFLTKRLIIGWGMPAIVVIVTASVSLDIYRAKKNYCLVSNHNPVAFYAAVFAPVCIILAINSYAFIRLSVIILKQRSAGKYSKTSSMRRPSLTQVRGTMSVMMLLGVTWLLGPLAIGEATLVFSYLFTILNTLQGFIIFLFNCVLNKEVQSAYKQLYTTGRRKRIAGSSTFSTTVRERSTVPMVVLAATKFKAKSAAERNIDAGSVSGREAVSLKSYAESGRSMKAYPDSDRSVGSDDDSGGSTGGAIEDAGIDEAGIEEGSMTRESFESLYSVMTKGHKYDTPIPRAASARIKQRYMDIIGMDAYK